MTTTEEIRTQLKTVASLKRLHTRLQRRLKNETDRLVAMVHDSGVKSIKLDLDTRTITGTLVAPESVRMDEAKLRKLVGAAAWKKVTTPVLDQKKLQKAIADGVVSIEDVSACSEVKHSAPYVRITDKEKPSAS